MMLPFNRDTCTMTLMTNFDYTKYPAAPLFVVYVDGTGHDQSCTAVDKAKVTPESLIPFREGGFDLFCSCADSWIPESAIEVEMESIKNHLGSGPKASAPVEKMEDGEDLTEDDVRKIIEELGRKFEVQDMTKPLIRFATAYAQSYSGTFSFMVDMKEAAGRKSGLSTGQAKGTMNCVRAEYNRTPRVERGSGSEELDLSALPSGTYAVPGGETRLKVSVSAPTKGRWEGWIFVSDGAEYGSQKRYGKQAPGSIYVGEIQDQLKAILADPQEAAAQYGRITGTCGLCNRPLEDEESVARGIGPVCAKKF